MAKFRVGQKVKCVRGPVNVGAVGTVTQIDVTEPGEDRELCEVEADFGFVDYNHESLTYMQRMPCGTRGIAICADWEPVTDTEIQELLAEHEEELIHG